MDNDDYRDLDHERERDPYAEDVKHERRPPMSANAAPRSNTIQLSPNVPVELVLKYQTGRQVSNGRIMFTTHSNECLFLDPEDAHKIHALGLAPNEPFRILR